MQQLLSERIRHRSHFAYVLIVFSYVTASEISLIYIYIYIQSCKKRNPTQIHKHEPKIKYENLNFCNLDRYLDRQYLSSLIKPRQITICQAAIELSVRRCRAICPALVNSFSSLVSWSNHHVFILDLNNMFLEVLNTSYIYLNTSKVRFIKGLVNYTKYVLNINYHILSWRNFLPNQFKSKHFACKKSMMTKRKKERKKNQIIL